jgi:hypothetical protein
MTNFDWKLDFQKIVFDYSPGIQRFLTCVTFDMRDSMSYADPGLKMRDTIALATVFTLKSDPDHPLTIYHSQSNLKSQQTLATAKCFNPFYNLNCSA